MVMNLPANAGDMGLIPGSEDPPEEETATHSSILTWRIPMDREACQVAVHGVIKESDMTYQLNTTTKVWGWG